MTGAQAQAGRNGIGESPVRLQGCVDGNFSKWHGQYRRRCLRPPRDRKEVKWTRRPGLGVLVVAFLFDPGRLARQAPQVVEAGPPDPTQFDYFQFLKPG